MNDYSIYYRNKNERLIRDGERIFEMQLKGVEGRDICIENSDGTTVQTKGCVYNSINPDSTTKEDRLLGVKIETNIDKGSYVFIEGEEMPFLALSDVDNHYAYKCCTLRQCNQKIRIDEDTYIYGIIEGESYGVKISSSDEFLRRSDVKIKVTVQRNPITENIPLNFRYCLGFSEHGIYSISDVTTYNKNILLFTCQKDMFIPDYDDIENGLCWNKDTINPTPTPTEYTISGQDSIRKGLEATYTINEPNGNFEVDGLDYEIVSRDNESIIIKCLDYSEFITINYLVNGEIVASKDVDLIR